MRRIAIANQKGGSCKTTTAVNLAAGLAELGRRVLLIDLDAQGNATRWVTGERDDTNRALYDVLDGKAPLAQAVRPTPIPNVDLVPSSQWLVHADTLSRNAGGQAVLRAALAAAVTSAPDRWDVCLMDCPPQLGHLSLSALAAADEVLVSIEPHAMPLEGVADLFATVEQIRRFLNPGLAITGVVACRVNLRARLHRAVLSSLRDTFGAAVFETVIRHDARLSEAPGQAQPITVYEPKSRGAADYRALAAEVEARIAAPAAA